MIIQEFKWPDVPILVGMKFIASKRYGIGSYFKAYIKIVLISSLYPANIMSILILFDSNLRQALSVCF